MFVVMVVVLLKINMAYNVGKCNNIITGKQ